MKEFDALLSQRATYHAKAPLGAASFDYFARAVGDTAAIYVDADAAMVAGYKDIIAPPTFVCETLQYSDRAPDENGYIGHAWDLPLDGWRRVRGGNAYRFHQPVVASDVLRVADVVSSQNDEARRRESSFSRSQDGILHPTCVFIAIF